MFVGDPAGKMEELGKVPCLAIAKAKEDRGICLHFCGNDWSPIAVAGKFDSVAAAERRAERIYPGSSALWSDAPFTEEDARAYLDEVWRDFRCHFCGKTPDETGASTFNNDKSVICSDCIVKFHAMLHESTPPENGTPQT
jgi:hypothetical protein